MNSINSNEDNIDDGYNSEDLFNDITTNETNYNSNNIMNNTKFTEINLNNSYDEQEFDQTNLNSYNKYEKENLKEFYDKLINNEIENLLLYKNDADVCNKIYELINVNKSLTHLFVNNCSLYINYYKLNKQSNKDQEVNLNNNLTISENKIHEIQNFNLFKSLYNNTSITHLSVDFNKFNNETINSLAEMIKINNTIQYLDISNCFIFNEDLIKICEALKVNKSITELDLSCNMIDTLKPICEALKVNTTLQKINLKNNKIIDLTPLLDILHSNNTLINIDLSNNKIEDINVLYDIIQQNKFIKQINLKSNKIKFIKPLYDLLTNNNITNNLLIKISYNKIEDIEYFKSSLLKTENLKSDEQTTNEQSTEEYFEYIDKLKEKNISYKIVNSEKNKNHQLKNIVAAPHAFKLHDNNPNFNIFIVMMNGVRHWYDFADIIGCFNYMLGMLRYSAKQSSENNELDESEDIINNSTFNAGLSMACSIQ